MVSRSYPTTIPGLDVVWAAHGHHFLASHADRRNSAPSIGTKKKNQTYDQILTDSLALGLTPRNP